MYEPRYREAKRDDQRDNGPEEAHVRSEPLGLEHGDAQIDEHHDGDAEQQALNPGHTRSRHQMRPRNAATNATNPTTTRKSAIGPMLPMELSTQGERASGARQQFVNACGGNRWPPGGSRA